MSNGTNIIRRFFDAWHARDRAAAEELLSEDFTFTSPFDDRIGKRAYFERCWPPGHQVRDLQIETLFANGAEGFIRYECAIETGPRFRNLEYFRIEGGKIKEVEVYFGSLPEEAA
jgi:hypothetical protein